MSVPVNVPPFQPIPAGATRADRERLLAEWEAELARLNPAYFNPDGSRRGFFAQLADLFR